MPKFNCHLENTMIFKTHHYLHLKKIVDKFINPMKKLQVMSQLMWNPTVQSTKMVDLKWEMNSSMSMVTASEALAWRPPETSSGSCQAMLTSLWQGSLKKLINLQMLVSLLIKVALHKVIRYIEVLQGDIFMEQKMRFWLVLGQLAILKKKLGLIMSNF